MDPSRLADDVRDDARRHESDMEQLTASALRAQLQAERRRGHRVRVLAFLLFVALTGAAVGLTQQPSYASNHLAATITECIDVIEHNNIPAEKRRAAAVGMAQCVRFLMALKDHPWTAMEQSDIDDIYRRIAKELPSR